MTRPGVDVRGRKSGMGSHQETVGGSDVWLTPPGIFDALTRGARAVREAQLKDAGVAHHLAVEMAGEREPFGFALDPCSIPGGVPWIPAARSISLPDDGLAAEWAGRVWLNPPYGKATVAWMRRLAAHGNGIALVFARTETRWWHETVGAAAAVCFIEGRLTFVDEQQRPGKFNGGAPSALVAYGEECAAAVAAAGLGMTFAVRSRELDGQGSLWEA